VYGSNDVFVVSKEKKERHKAVEFVCYYTPEFDLYRLITRHTNNEGIFCSPKSDVTALFSQQHILSIDYPIES